MSSSTDDLLPVGYVRRAHGLRGEVVVHSDSDHPGRFAPGTTFYADGDPGRPLVVDESAAVPGGVIVGFAGIAERAAAEGLRGITLFIRSADRRSLGEDEFWPDDLAGASAFDPAGSRLGTVTAVVFGAAQDRLVVTTAAGIAVEVPFVAAIVTEVSVGDARVVIDPPEGLFPS